MEVPQAPGWYDDPDDSEQLRYFDGIVWSDRRVPKRVERPAPAPAHGPVPGHGTPPARTPGVDVYGRPTGASPRVRRPVDPGYEQYGHDSYARPRAEQTADGQPLASYGMRVAAYLVDNLVVGVLNLLVAGWAYVISLKEYFAFVSDAVAADDPDQLSSITPEQVAGLIDLRWYFVGLALSTLVYVLYYTLLVGLKGGGVGKLALGLRVRRVDRPGPPGVGPAFMRLLIPLLTVVPVLCYLTVLVLPADLLWPLKDDKRQALHDKMAGTQVVEKGR